MAAYGDTGKGSGYNSYARVSSIIRKATQDENPYLQFVSTEEVLGGSKKGDTINRVALLRSAEHFFRADELQVGVLILRGFADD